jgi:hypothetical protein
VIFLEIKFYSFVDISAARTLEKPTNSSLDAPEGEEDDRHDSKTTDMRRPRQHSLKGVLFDFDDRLERFVYAAYLVSAASPGICVNSQCVAVLSVTMILQYCNR